MKYRAEHYFQLFDGGYRFMANENLLFSFEQKEQKPLIHNGQGLLWIYL